VSDTLGGDFIYSVLSNDSGVIAITTAIYNSRMVPETEDDLTTINFYPVGTYDASLTYFQIPWSIDCRAPTSYESLDLALAVRDAMNRETAAVGGFVYHGVIQIGAAIPPLDQADVFNTPVTITVRRK
jgi:hypothetical protein